MSPVTRLRMFVAAWLPAVLVVPTVMSSFWAPWDRYHSRYRRMITAAWLAPKLVLVIWALPASGTCNRSR